MTVSLATDAETKTQSEYIGTGAYSTNDLYDYLLKSTSLESKEDVVVLASIFYFARTIKRDPETDEYLITPGALGFDWGKLKSDWAKDAKTAAPRKSD